MAEARLQILLDLQDNVTKAIGNVSAGIDKVGERAKQLEPAFKQAAVVGTAGFAAIGAALYGSVQAAIDAENVQAQLGAVLKSTGNAAGLFAEDILDQASALQQLTTYDDEAITSMANLLLTFTNVKGAVFQEAMPAILDMSTALGQDLKSSAIQVGKALNDPILGVSALRKVGVNFTEDQQAVIQSLVETGKTAEAQRLILKELNTEFGGSASAAAKTFAGQLQQLKNRLGDVFETIGKQLVPILEKALKAAMPILEWIEKMVTEHPKLTLGIMGIVGGFFALIAVVGLAGMAIGSFATLAATLGIGLGALLGWLAIIPIAFAAIVAAGIAIYKNWDTIKLTLEGLWIEIQEVFSAIVSFFESVWGLIKDIFNFHVAIIVGIVEAGLNLIGTDIRSVMNAISAFWKMIWKAIGDFVSPILESVKGFIDEAFAWISNAFNTVVDPVRSVWSSLWDSISGIVSGAWNGIKNVVKESINWMIDKINSLINAINSVASKGAGVLGISAPQIPTIPRLASGGIVTKPTIAMIGEAGPEAVVPLGSRRMAGAGGFGNINITITGNTFMDDREAAMKLGAQLVRYIKDNLAL